MRRVSTLASGKSLLLVSSRSFSFSLNHQFAFPLSLSSCLEYMSWSSSQLNTKKGIFKAVQRSLWDSYLPANTTLLAALALIKAHFTTRADFWACLCLSFLCNNQKTFYRKDVKSIGFMSFFFKTYPVIIVLCCLIHNWRPLMHIACPLKKVLSVWKAFLLFRI